MCSIKHKMCQSISESKIKTYMTFPNLANKRNKAVINKTSIVYGNLSSETWKKITFK